MFKYNGPRRRVKLSSLPDAKTLNTVSLSDLSGGLNIWDLSYNLSTDQSPNMKNMMWRDGMLGSRYGQSFLLSDELGVGYAMHDALFNGYLIMHVGTYLYAVNPNAETPVATQIYAGLTSYRGSFVTYEDTLYYKTKNRYVAITYDDSLTFPVEAADVVGYVPVIVINAAPSDGSGDIYQPENRLSEKKTVWYNVTEESTDEIHLITVSGSSVSFSTDAVISVSAVKLNGTLLTEDIDYEVDIDNQQITLTEAFAIGDTFVITVGCWPTTYQLPVTNIDGVDEVLVCDIDTATWNTLTYGTDYAIARVAGTVTFLLDSTTPKNSTPATNNTVYITYSKENSDAEDAIMGCRYATFFGATGMEEQIVVLGGCEAQPNAIFWSGNNSTGLDPTYFPLDQYNLVGEFTDPVTGFGKQQNMLVIFQERRITRGEFTTEEVNERDVIAIQCYTINPGHGCDLPWTIQLISNNLVWAHTDLGVCYLKDSTSAYENMVVNISKNVDGTAGRDGLKTSLKAAVSRIGADKVCSLDDNQRYWICTGDDAYVWDYNLQDYTTDVSNLPWFYFTGFAAIAWCRDGDSVWHLNASGQISYINGSFSDYDEAYERVFQSAVLTFGSYYKVKDVPKTVFAVRSDTDADIGVTYLTDYEERDDLTDISVRAWSYVPRNLEYRDLSVFPYAVAAVRRPGCKHVRHFSVKLTNSVINSDLGIVAIQVFYTFQGVDR